MVPLGPMSSCVNDHHSQQWWKSNGIIGANGIDGAIKAMDANGTNVTIGAVAFKLHGDPYCHIVI
jgi:hypothetical protein